MSHANPSKRPRPVRFLFENSIFLIAGALGALIWANLSPTTYEHFSHFDVMSVLRDTENDHHHEPGSADRHTDPDEHQEATEDQTAATVANDSETNEASDHETAGHDTDGEQHGGGPAHGLTLHFLVNDLFMALFFAIAGKEVLEALLPGGALSNPRKAATPLMATLGGIIGPAGIYVAGVLVCSNMGLTTWKELGSGWAVPCATDIAFSYLVARIIFGAGHPAIAFLLLLAIADDAAGLVILAVFYPTGVLALQWLLLSVGGMALGFVFQKYLKLSSFWWYLIIPGAMSWFAFYKSGIHPALGLVPIVICMPHAKTDLGIFAREELGRHDALNAFEHWWKNPVELILGLFGLVNAGVAMSNVGVGTWLILGGLILGKPIGIVLFTWIGQRFFKLEIPGGMGYRHVLSIGMVAGIGFTVALFVSTAAFPIPPTSPAVLDAVKMGALGSFFAAVVAFVGARMMGIRADGVVVEPTVSLTSDEEATSDTSPVNATKTVTT
jgi:NhaA family Na+:H+ antiporter